MNARANRFAYVGPDRGKDSEVLRNYYAVMQTTGGDAEQFHDLIDAARETTDRHNFSDSVIMTTWHEDAITISDMVDVADLCMGGADYVLLLVIGNDSDLRTVVEEMQQRLRK